MEDKIHVCKSCGRTAGGAGHLCAPAKLKEAFYYITWNYYIK
jgi:hypothetical protein